MHIDWMFANLKIVKGMNFLPITNDLRVLKLINEHGHVSNSLNPKLLTK